MNEFEKVKHQFNTFSTHLRTCRKVRLAFGGRIGRLRAGGSQAREQLRRRFCHGHQCWLTTREIIVLVTDATLAMR